MGGDWLQGSAHQVSEYVRDTLRDLEAQAHSDKDAIRAQKEASGELVPLPQVDTLVRRAGGAQEEKSPARKRKNPGSFCFRGPTTCCAGAIGGLEHAISEPFEVVLVA